MDKIINAILDNDFDWFSSLIREKGVDIQDKNGFTPLMICLQSGRKEMVDYLLQNGADVNKTNILGNSSLFYAVFNSHNDTDIIEKLFKAGADMNIKNKAGVSPLSLAKSMANEKVREFFEKCSTAV